MMSPPENNFRDISTYFERKSKLRSRRCRLIDHNFRKCAFTLAYYWNNMWKYWFILKNFAYKFRAG